MCSLECKARPEKKRGEKSVHRAVNARIQRNMQILLVLRDDHKILPIEQEFQLIFQLGDKEIKRNMNGS